MFDKGRMIQFLRFCTVGVGNTAVDFAVFFALTWGGMSYLPAQAVSYSAGVANSFFFNRRWTFRMAGKTRIVELARFIAVNGFSLLASAGLLYILHDANHLDLGISKIAATGVSVILNFIGSRLWVFTERPQLEIKL